MLRYVNTMVLSLMAAWMTGCATSTEPETVLFDKLNDPRIGEKVSQVCFTRSIQSWSQVDNDRNALIVIMNDKKSYKVTMAGACDPDWARIGIAVISRGSSNCFGPGDRIATDAQVSRRASCTITRVHAWDPDAKLNDDSEEHENEQVENE